MAQIVNLQPVSNTEDWDDSFEITADDGEPFDLSAVTAITLVVWDPDTRCKKLEKEIGDGITIDDAVGGVISIHVDADEMSALCAKAYEYRVGMVNGATKDLMIGTLPILDGGPT